MECWCLHQPCVRTALHLLTDGSEVQSCDGGDSMAVIGCHCSTSLLVIYSNVPNLQIKSDHSYICIEKNKQPE